MGPDDAGPDDTGLQELYLIADELHGAGTMASHFASGVHERERGEQMIMLAGRLRGLADRGAGAAPFDPPVRFDTEGLRRVSPAIGVEVVVFDRDGRLLLARRRDDRTWCLPGGVCEIGQSPPNAALRELWEEAGVRGEVERLLGVFDGRLWGSRSTSHILNLIHLVRSDDPRPSPGVEMVETAFFATDALPADLHPGHDQRIPYALELVRTGRTHHDPADTRTGDLPMHQRP